MPCRAHLAHIGESANYFDGRHLCHLGHHVHPRFTSYTLHCNCAVVGMRVGWVWCARRVVRHNVKATRRLLSSQAQPQTDALQRATRNIGIIAHIDAVSIMQDPTNDKVVTFSRVKRLRRSACSITAATPDE